jgi:Protein of unknown function (DUF998)
MRVCETSPRATPCRCDLRITRASDLRRRPLARRFRPARRVQPGRRQHQRHRSTNGRPGLALQQVAANLNGLLIVAFALGLWHALGAGWPARLGVLGLALLGVTRFLEGFLRLDCRSMDEGCENTSWQANAHGIESGIASALFFLVPPVLAFAFRRLPQWRDLWLPTLLAVPIVVPRACSSV